MDTEQAKGYLDLLKRQAHKASGIEHTNEDIKEAAITHLKQRAMDAVDKHFREMSLEHLLHLLAVDVPDGDN